MTFHIRRHEALAAGLQRIAREQIGLVLRDFADERCAVDVRIHSLRARCKKLRALLLLPGPVMGAAFAVEDARLHAAGSRLGGIRDAQVRAEKMAALGDAQRMRLPEWDEAATHALDESLAELRNTLAAIDSWPLPVQGFCDIAPGFAHTYRNCVVAWEHVGHDPSDEHFHRLRKWTKNHWYQVRILERLNKPILRRRRRALRRLGLLLGDAHDLVVLEVAAQSPADARLAARARRRKQKIYKQAQVLARKLFAPDADTLVADMSRWWARWRE